LTVVFLTSFLFSGCFTFTIFFNSFYYEYDFANINNKNVTIGSGQWASPKLKLKDINFFFSLDKDFEQKGRESNIYYKSFISIYVPKDKYVNHIFINKVAVYSDEAEYSMLERVKSVSLYSLEDNAYFLKEEEITDVQHTGLINCIINTDNENTTINAQQIFVRFFSIPIDSKYKKIRMLFDISVKYTTDEEITINQEVTGFLKLKKRPQSIWEYIWFPTT